MAMSYVLARGRTLRPGVYGIDGSELPPFETGRVDPRQWFDDGCRPLEIEIGAGKGTFLVQQAPKRPEVNYLGIEKSSDLYRYAADRMRRRRIDNVRILRTDAAEFVRFWCRGGVARVIHLYFSDPWPKKRHHKRRVIQDQTMIEIHRVLCPGGELRLVTDHADLWAWYEDHAARHASFFERRRFVCPEAAGEGEIVGTNFERKYRAEGRPFFSMTLVRGGDEVRRTD